MSPAPSGNKGAGLCGYCCYWMIALLFVRAIQLRGFSSHQRLHKCLPSPLFPLILVLTDHPQQRTPGSHLLIPSPISASVGVKHLLNI